MYSDYEELTHHLQEVESVLNRRRRENAESVSMLGRMIQSIVLPIFILDKDHTIIFYNAACEDFTGLSAADQIGTRHQWRAFCVQAGPVLADLLIDRVEEAELRKIFPERFGKSPVIQDGYEAEGFFPDLGESGRWLFFTAAPLTNGSGEIIGAVQVFQDITDRKMAELAIRENHQRYRALLDFVPYPIVVSRLDGRVYYVNPAYTELFGWQLEEIRHKDNPFIPPELRWEAQARIETLKYKDELDPLITQRVTRNGQRRTVEIKTKLFTEIAIGRSWSHEIMRDITQNILETERREAIIRISQALPEYPDLEGLLDFISGEIKQLIGTEGAAVILLDEEKQELYIPGASYDDSGKQRRVKEVRFGLDELFAGEVINTREPVIVHDTSKTDRPYAVRDKKFGYHTRNFLLVPLRSGERVIGVLCAINIKEGQFDQSHVDLLTMMASTVALSIENARATDEIRRAYLEVSRLNRAKTKAIQHLSHELRTPLSIMIGSLSALESRLQGLPAVEWMSTLDRISRNLSRIAHIREAVEDIMGDQVSPYRQSTMTMLNMCQDVIETTLAAEGMNTQPVMDALRVRLKSYFSPDDDQSAQIQADRFVRDRFEILKPLFSHRNLDVRLHLTPCPEIQVPEACLRKCVDGFLKNAIENTPDEGRIDVWVDAVDGGCRIEIADLGVGITPGSQELIFRGFFTTREAQNYSSKRPFDFNAGGKGADLLRIKIFSERYGFTVNMNSLRCRYIPADADLCPGRISLCRFCTTPADCRASGFSRFSIHFPADLRAFR